MKVVATSLLRPRRAPSWGRRQRTIAKPTHPTDDETGESERPIKEMVGYRPQLARLLASYQRIALLTNTFRDPELMIREGRCLERWIDSLAHDSKLAPTCWSSRKLVTTTKAGSSTSAWMWLQCDYTARYQAGRGTTSASNLRRAERSVLGCCAEAS